MTMKRDQRKKRNGLVQAMTLRHAGGTRMKNRRDKRQGNPKRSWRGEM
jgi:hypothetical protein